MSRLLPYLLLLLLALPANAEIFDSSRPQSALFGTPLNNSQDFLPVDKAFRLDLLETGKDSVRLRFINAEGYYLYKHRFGKV